MSDCPRAFSLSIFLLLLCMGWVSQSVLATERSYQFESTEQAERFEKITKRLRCVTCPNQSIADSQAPVAQTMREITVEMIRQDKSNDEIEQYFLERYGQYVLYQPKINTQTYLLWSGPLLFLIIGGIAVFSQCRRSNQLSNEPPKREQGDQRA